MLCRAFLVFVYNTVCIFSNVHKNIFHLYNHHQWLRQAHIIRLRLSVEVSCRPESWSRPAPRASLSADMWCTGPAICKCTQAADTAMWVLASNDGGAL